MRGAAVLLGLTVLAPSALRGQDPAMARAFELERRGNYVAAADAYRGVLAARPADVAALLGLERALLPAGRSEDILPQVRAALATAPSSSAIFGVALRAFAAADEPDSIRVVAERWAAASPGDETPFREWGAAALGRRDRQGAAAAYLRGREQLHRPDALAAELAQLAIQDGDFAGALREWLPAIRRFPGYRGSAVNSLASAPDSIRSDLLRQLDREEDFPARRLQADLRARWGDPLGALDALQKALPEERRAALEALRGMLDQLRTQPGRDARRGAGSDAGAHRGAQHGLGARPRPARRGARLHRRGRAGSGPSNAGGHRRGPQRAGRHLGRSVGHAGPGVDR